MSQSVYEALRNTSCLFVKRDLIFLNLEVLLQGCHNEHLDPKPTFPSNPIKFPKSKAQCLRQTVIFLSRA